MPGSASTRLRKCSPRGGPSSPSRARPCPTTPTSSPRRPSTRRRWPPQVWRVLADVQEAWAADPQARACLDAVLTRAQDSLARLGGLSTADYLVSALAPEGGPAGTQRLVAGLLRLALDRADIVERG